MSESALQEQYDYLFRTASDGLIVVGATGKIARINPAAAAMLRLAPETGVGHLPSETFKDTPLLVTLLNTNHETTLEFMMPGSRLAAATARTLKGGVRLAVIQDVTEQRDLESRREALARRIAHDMRNLLSAMEGYADLVEKFGAVNAKQQHFLRRIGQTSRKLHDLAGTLVDLAWLEAGLPLQHVPVHINDLVESVVAELAMFARQRGQSIAVSAQDPMPVVMGDPQRLRQVVYHLLHNALLYSYGEQSVAIHCWQDDGQAYCSVADQGMGILPGELDLVFDRMYRSQDEAVRNLPGGGLGLTISRTIVERHGGRIIVESTYGQGSTFTFELPMAEAL